MDLDTPFPAPSTQAHTCSSAFTMVDPAGTNVGLTAGHCFSDTGTDKWAAIPSNDASDQSNPPNEVQRVGFQRTNAYYSSRQGLDAATFSIADETKATNHIYVNHGVSRSVTSETHRASLTPGASVCITSRFDIHCGKIMTTKDRPLTASGHDYSGSAIRVNMKCRKGDSGGAIYQQTPGNLQASAAGVQVAGENARSKVYQITWFVPIDNVEVVNSGLHARLT